MGQSLWLKISGVLHAVVIPAALWLWNERRVLKEVLEDGLERRNEHKGEKQMLNPITIVTDINMAVTAIQKVQATLPQIQKTVADIKQAIADKQDTTKLDADLVSIMADIQTDLSDVAELFPTAPVTTPTPAAPAQAA